MGIFSAIAIGLAACIILPTYYSLEFGKTTFTNPTYDYKPRFDLLDLVSRMFVNAYDTVRPQGLPIIYCGTLTMIMLPLFFMAKRVPMRQKVGTGILIGVFVLSFSIDAIDKFWHGMQAPNWLNYRYSFMLVFIMIIAAAKAFAEIRNFSTGQKAGVIGAWFIILMISQKSVEFYTEDKIVVNRDLLCFYVAAIMLAIYAGALALYRHRQYRRVAASVVLVFICFEMIGQAISSIYYLHDDVVFSTRTSYHNNKNKFEPAADYILENDDSFYRFDKTTHSLINTPMMLGIRGFTNSTSTLNHDTIDFLRYMGISSSSHWSKYYGGTPPFDSFLAVKYIIADPDYDVPEGYISLSEFKNKEGELNNTVYQNPNALSVAYAVNSNVKDVHLAYPKGYAEAIENGEYEEFTAYHTPPERMNVLMGAMLGLDEPVDMFIPIEDVTENEFNIARSITGENHEKFEPTTSGQSASIEYTFTVTHGGIVYMYIPTNYPRELNVTVNDVEKGTALGNETNRMISLGKFSAGETVEVSLTLNKDVLYILRDEPFFWELDMDVYNTSFQSLAENQFNIEKWSDTKFEGIIKIPSDRTTVFTSLPYDENWRVWIDGEPVATYENLQALVAFDAEPGTHKLIIKYVPKQLYIGLCITIASATLLIAVYILDKQIKKRNELIKQSEDIIDAIINSTDENSESDNQADENN